MLERLSRVRSREDLMVLSLSGTKGVTSLNHKRLVTAECPRAGLVLPGPAKNEEGKIDIRP